MFTFQKPRVREIQLAFLYPSHDEITRCIYLVFPDKQLLGARARRPSPKEVPVSKSRNLYQKDLLSLPFFDDFAQHNAIGVYPNSAFWLDSSAYVNNHLSISPLTLGVATLDGLNKKGMPYDFSDQYAQGPADTLTSQPINLAGLDSSDQVFLMFHYQAGGLGNMPDAEDSLYLDFYSPLTQSVVSFLGQHNGILPRICARKV
jgi:hypothetical protein